MSNHYFQFREFSIEQDRCAMKVSTDACIQGAWTPILPSVNNVLDIGTGTGLLSLMLAQRNPTLQIDAIEIDQSAAVQAKENVVNSKFDNIHIYEDDATKYPFDKNYNLIICNPPFFAKSLLGRSAERNNARHTITLNFENLFEIISKNISEDGCASIMLPVAEHHLWEKLLLANNWEVFQELMVIPVEGRAANRVVSLCRKVRSDNKKLTVELIIRKTVNEYTKGFRELMGAFYL